jgi:hypothetical protein
MPMRITRRRDSVAKGFALIEKPYCRDMLAASLRSAVEGRGASA